MYKYLLGFLLNFFNFRVSKFAKIDNLSKINKKAKIYRNAQIFNSVIGDYSYVGVGTEVIFAEIGKFCSIGNNCICGMGVHTLNNLSTSPIFTERNNALGLTWVNASQVYPYKKLIIGNDVWIGERVMIMGGLTIGNGAVIGAGAIVTKDVPPYSVVAGVPAKVLKYRFPQEIIDKLQSSQWWNLEKEVIQKNITLFQTKNLTLQSLEDLI